jgi:hypothetical protein
MLARQTFDAGGRPGDPLADHGLGFQAFGGAETTFAGAPQFAVSIDIGYRWLPAPFTGFDRSGVRVDVSGHWYLK